MTNITLEPVITEVAAVPQAPAVTQRSVAIAEWIKFRTVRSNIVSLCAAAVVLVGLGALFSALAGSGESFGPDQPGGTDSLTMSFAAIDISQLVLGVLGAVFVAGEYTSGMIRTMFAVVPDRLRLLWAKSIVVGAAAWAAMTAASFAAFFIGRSLYAGDGAVYGLGDDGVLRAVAAGGVYGAGVALMGVGLGFVLRSTAATIGSLVATLMLAPGLIGLLPDPAGETIAKFMPSNAGQAFLSVSGSDLLLSPAAGFAVFCAWVVGFLALAAAMLRRRDA